MYRVILTKKKTKDLLNFRVFKMKVKRNISQQKLILKVLKRTN